MPPTPPTPVAIQRSSSGWVRTELWLGLLLWCAGCGAAHRPESGGERVRCPDGSTRISVSCQSVAQLKSRVFEANLGLPKIKLGLSVAYEEQAVAQVSDATQQLAFELDAKCAQYNACAIDAERWLASEDRLRRHLSLVAGLTARPGALQGDQVWANAVPEAAGRRLSLQLQVQARAANGSFAPHRSGEPLASGRALRFIVQSNIPAYVYLLLLSSQGRAEQLLPQPALQQKNPVAAGTAIAIPPASTGTFVLDDQAGTEHLQILASAQPLNDIEARLDALGARGHSGGEVLQAIASLLCAPLRQPSTAAQLSTTSATCQQHSTRGLVLVPDSASDAPVTPGTTVLQAEPCDEVVVLQHGIDHVPASGS